MARAPKRAILLALGLAMALAGCASGPKIDGMMPAGAPARPATPHEYPAVHDMPPPRAAPTMTEDQQLKLENELTTVRDRQEAHEETGKKTAQGTKKKATKKKPATADKAQAAGAKTNP